jgi:hypothetical protein
MLKEQEEFSCQTIVRQSVLRKKLAITDVDGALTSIRNYFVTARENLLRKINIRLTQPVHEPAEEIKGVIERRRTHEHPWLLIPVGTSGVLIIDLDQFGMESSSLDEVLSPSGVVFP